MPVIRRCASKSHPPLSLPRVLLQISDGSPLFFHRLLHAVTGNVRKPRRRIYVSFYFFIYYRVLRARRLAAMLAEQIAYPQRSSLSRCRPRNGCARADIRPSSGDSNADASACALQLLYERAAKAALRYLAMTTVAMLAGQSGAPSSTSSVSGTVSQPGLLSGVQIPEDVRIVVELSSGDPWVDGHTVTSSAASWRVLVSGVVEVVRCDARSRSRGWRGRGSR